MRQADYYKKLKPAAIDLENSERVVCGDMHRWIPRRAARQQFRAYRRKNERRLQRDLLEKAQRVEGVSGPVVTGVLTWLAGWLLTPLIDSAKRALWAAVKQHVKEILDRLQAELFPEGEK